MMKIKYSILLLIAVISTMFGACYDDKGNYDYKALNQIEIDYLDIDYTVVLGDTIEYFPTFKYALPDTSNVNFSYEWSFAGKKIGNGERKLFWIIDTVAQGNLVIRVKDLDSGVEYIQKKIVWVLTPYVNQGWLILSEKNGFSSLSYIRENTEEDEVTKEDVYKNIVHENLYKTVNKSELGTAPKKFIEHEIRANATYGNILVMQDGPTGSVDVSGTTFEKELDMNEAFLNGTYPLDFHPVNAFYMYLLNLIENYDGRIFTRIKPTFELFNAGFFIQEPLMMDDQDIRGSLIPGAGSSFRGGLIHDKGTTTAKQNRLLIFMEQNRSDPTVGCPVKVLPNPAKGWPKNYIPLNNMGDNELLYIRYVEEGYTDCGFFMLIKDKNNKYWHQEFRLDDEDFELSYTDEESTLNVHEMPAGFNYEDCLIYGCSSKENPWVMIARGQDLYLYNRKAPNIADDPETAEDETSGDGVKWYYHFDSEIVGMNAESYLNKRLGVSLADGTFVVLNIDNGKNLLTDKEKFLWMSPNSFGKIVDMKFKTGSSLP